MITKGINKIESQLNYIGNYNKEHAVCVKSSHNKQNFKVDFH